MNDEAQKVLADMMQRALNGVDQAVEFGKAEIPAVVEQLLMWHMVESLIFCLASLALIYFAVRIFMKALPSMQKARESYERGESWTRYSDSGSGLTSTTYDLKATGIAYYIGSFVLLVIGLSMFSTTWLKIWIAPKLYLLEYGASLVK